MDPTYVRSSANNPSYGRPTPQQNGNMASMQKGVDPRDTSVFRPRESFNTKYMTTNGGCPIYNNMDSLTAGQRGPVLLEDFHLVEKLANFDRERIPERVVHARGIVAKGVFTCTRDITNLTMAEPFRHVGAETPVSTRFSTVVHSRHSPETLRDPRGFACKFYTKSGGIWDLVGNNMPVFFIRDAMAFPGNFQTFFLPMFENFPFF